MRIWSLLKSWKQAQKSEPAKRIHTGEKHEPEKDQFGPAYYY